MTATWIDRLIFSAVLALIQLSIAVHVCRNTHHKTVKLSFFALSSSLAAWTIAIGLAHTAESSSLAMVRASFVAASLLVLALLTFVAVFPASSLPNGGWYRVFAVLGLGFSLASVSPLIVRESSYGSTGLMVMYGVLHPAYAAYVVCGIVVALGLLRSKLNSSVGRQQLQLRYLVLALIVPAIGIATTNLVIPLVFKVSSWGRYGPAFTVVFLGVTAHAIIRERLMDVRLVVGQTVSYAAAVVVSGGLFGAATLFFVRRVMPVPDLLGSLQLIVVFGFAVAFGPITQWFRRVFDRYLHREPYDFYATIRRSNAALSSTLDLGQLFKAFVGIIQTSIRPEFVAAYMRANEDSSRWRLALYEHRNEASDEGFVDNRIIEPIATCLAKRGGVLFRETEEPGTAGARGALAALGAECACPIVHESHLLAVVLLGPKLSGDAYYALDIDLLGTLAGNAAVAVRNAELYQRVTLLEAERRRAERLAESGALTAGIAHEIKNPLVAIRTFAELLPERYDDEEFRSQFAQVMITEIARIDKLVDRLRGRRFALDAEALNCVDIAVPLDEVVSLVSPKCGQEGIKITKSYSRETNYVRGRVDDLKQLFLNVLINAIEAMRNGGEVFVRVLSTETLGVKRIVVEIGDEGPGISEEIRERLFHPFVSTKQGSSGLGLWLSRQIADSHSASMRGANRGDRAGAVFSIEFPSYPGGV